MILPSRFILVSFLAASLASCGSVSTSDPTTSSSASSSSMSSSSSAVAEGKDVIVTAPIVGSIVKSPLIVQGKARGSWFFEGSLPIVITDTNDNIIAVAPAEALGEWMTIDYVDFTATITFSTKATSGFIIVKKNNPSGLPENDSQVKIPVTF